jgi:hypothetical protein
MNLDWRGCMANPNTAIVRGVATAIPSFTLSTAGIVRAAKPVATLPAVNKTFRAAGLMGEVKTGRINNVKNKNFLLNVIFMPYLIL